jgi:hypothetical protein
MIRGALPELTALVAQPMVDSGTAERRFRVEHRDGRPIDRKLLALLAGGRQVIRGDTIIIGAEPFATRGGGFEDINYDPMIQDDDRDILALGTEFRLRGPTRPSLADLAATLRGMIRIDTSAAAPLDAMGALRTRRAQPDGLVRLYVAVLRASGVPARMVIGVSPQGSALRTHAWAEVRESRGTGWLAVDPLLGRVPAATSLIRVAHGGSSHPGEMLALLADVRFIDLGHSESLP